MGVDRFIQMTPKRYHPGIGLRPGGELPDFEPLIVTLYQAMCESIAIHSRLGLNVVVDVGHHDGYSGSRGIFPKSARKGLPVLFVGVRCPIEVVVERRLKTGYIGYTAEGKVQKPVSLWQKLVHVPGIYDLEVDTSILTPEECANLILQRIKNGPPPTAFQCIENI